MDLIGCVYKVILHFSNVNLTQCGPEYCTPGDVSEFGESVFISIFHRPDMHGCYAS